MKYDLVSGIESKTLLKNIQECNSFKNKYTIGAKCYSQYFDNNGQKKVMLPAKDLIIKLDDVLENQIKIDIIGREMTITRIDNTFDRYIKIKAESIEQNIFWIQFASAQNCFETIEEFMANIWVAIFTYSKSEINWDEIKDGWVLDVTLV